MRTMGTMQTVYDYLVDVWTKYSDYRVYRWFLFLTSVPCNMEADALLSSSQSHL